METSIILIAVVGLMNIICFFIGAKIGQKVVKGETITTPTLNPVKAIENYKESKEYKQELEVLSTNLENIDNYDGTGLGQKDFD